MDELIVEIREHLTALRTLNEELYGMETNLLINPRSDTIEDYLWTIESEIQDLEDEIAEI